MTNPVVTAVTTISAPAETVWRVLVAFDQYAQWHPTLFFAANPEQLAVGTELPARAADQNVTLKVTALEPPHRLVWEGGSPDTLLGTHSFVLTPHPDGTTTLTDTEHFSGPIADDVIPTLAQRHQDFTHYGTALKSRAESHPA